MKRNTSTITKISRGILLLIIGFILVLVIYSLNYYHVSEEMYTEIDQLEISEITKYSDFDEISYKVVNPKNNIIFIPGGKVEAEAYEYLAYNLALDGNNVTIYKPYLHLAIVFPNSASRFIEEDMNNILIGHSLGGVVSAMLAEKNEEIEQVILLGSYASVDLTDKEVLLISAELDTVMVREEYVAAYTYYDAYSEYEIAGGNHAQFGWYGEQDGDSEASISTLEQQNIIIQKIIEFIN